MRRTSCSGCDIANGRWSTSSEISGQFRLFAAARLSNLADDNTFVDKEWGKELCRQLIPLKLRWFTETDITVAQDSELLSLMRRAGCRQVLIGLESPEVRRHCRDWVRGGNSKQELPIAAAAVREIQSHGITVNGCFIPGLDSHTPDIFEQILQFSRENHLFDVQITVLTAFPARHV